MSIYLNTIFTSGAFAVKERHGKEFNKIRRLQPKDGISCRYVVYRGNIQLEEFRRKQAALNFAADESFRESHSGPRANNSFKTESFKANLQSRADLVRDRINEMPDKGDTSETSQKICLLNALGELEKNINGITDEDLKP